MLHFLFVAADSSALYSEFQCDVILLGYVLLLLWFQLSALLDGLHLLEFCIAPLSFLLEPNWLIEVLVSGAVPPLLWLAEL